MFIKRNIILSKIKKQFGHLAPLPFSMANSYKNDENEGAFLHEGDLHLSNLSLTYADYEEDDMPSVIVITGSLIVDELIWNEEYDFGIHLLVMKDLKARNIAVGGQSLFIWGNLEVEHILCGFYNHGEMHVKGNIMAQIIFSDDFQMTCEGDFIGSKVGLGNFYNAKKDKYFEPEYRDLDMIFGEHVFNEHGFTLENLVKCLKNNEEIRVAHTPQDDAYLAFIKPIVTSSLIPKHHPYFLKLSGQKLEIRYNELILHDDADVVFRYALENESMTIEKLEELGAKNVKDLPLYMRNKTYRLLKLAHHGWSKHEKTIEERLSVIPHFYGIWDILLKEEQRESIGKRIELALKNPAWYCKIFQKDCEKREDNNFTPKLYISAFIDAMIEQGIAVSLHEKQSLEDAKIALTNLKAFSTKYDEAQLTQIKWGRKLFAFSGDMLTLNTALPNDTPFNIKILRHYPNEFVCFLADKKPFLDENIKQLFEVFQLS